MKSTFEAIAAGLRDAVAISKGEAVEETYRVNATDIDVKAIRARLGLTQMAFAERFGFAAAMVKDWEQKRRRPRLSGRILLRIIAREPEAVLRALSA